MSLRKEEIGDVVIPGERLKSRDTIMRADVGYKSNFQTIKPIWRECKKIGKGASSLCKARYLSVLLASKPMSPWLACDESVANKEKPHEVGIVGGMERDREKENINIKS